MHVHFIIHESFEAPGAYETWARIKGNHVTYSRVYEGEALPSSVDDIDFLIVMGGPQDLSRAADFRFVHTPAELRAHDYREMNQALFTFLDKLAGRYNQSRQ